jgi:hypothetical protein
MSPEENPKDFVGPLPGIISVDEIAAAHLDVVEDLQGADPIAAATIFAGLLTVPELQSNCMRIEALVLLALAYGEVGGTATALEGLARRCFSKIGDGQLGRLEDPAEDEFVALVGTLDGNFRIFEGIWEGAGFHLARVLDIVETMPREGPFAELRNSIQALLILSDAVVERAGLSEHTLGGEAPVADLPESVVDKASVTRKFVEFSENDLAKLGLSKTALTDFTFDMTSRVDLRSQLGGNTSLERRPVVLREGRFYLLLPTAVGPAIVRCVIEFVLSAGLHKTFERALAERYARLFRESRVLGDIPKSFEFQRIDGGFIANAIVEIDPGRFLHFFFFVDGIEDFVAEGFNGTNRNEIALSFALDLSVRQASETARASAVFLGGVTLVVSCGYGRGATMYAPGELPSSWRFESISSYDLAILNWLPDFDAIGLWRLLDSRDAIASERVKLLNVNGLLNLVAWSKQLGGHLVPHGSLPEEFSDPDTEGLVVVPQNALRILRNSVSLQWSPRRIFDPEGRWTRVRKLDRSDFEEDNRAPIFASEDDVFAGKLRAVYRGPERSWWLDIGAPDGAPSRQIYQHWMMLCVWLRRAAPILDRAYRQLPAAPLLVTFRFSEIVGISRALPDFVDVSKLRSLVSVSAEEGLPKLTIDINEGFEDGFARPENVAEKILIEALVKGISKIGGESENTSKQEQLVAEICPSSEARWVHRFQANSFRDRVNVELDDRTLVLIDPVDDGMSRIGLGWRARSRKDGSMIYGVAECTAYLNDVVRAVLDDLCNSIHSLDRGLFVEQLLRNYEAAVSDRDLWKRTAQSNVALHEDKAAAVQTIIEHNSRLNACFLASRILLEAAICECPLTGGRTPGSLDLSRALAQAMRLYYLGGWSDAIHWGAMEPRLRITPLGDVHANHDFIDNIYEAFGRVIGVQGVEHAVSSYAKIYEPAVAVPTVVGLLDNEFLSAWEAEYGTSLDSMRAFLDRMEELCEKVPSLFVHLARSNIDAVFAEAAGIAVGNAHAALDNLILGPRPAWRLVKDPFVNKDWFPWRFRRRLSVLRRPLIQVDEGADPTIVVAPGLVRDALFFTVRSFHDGGAPASQARSREMVRWLGHANRVQRSQFNLFVADRMRELGWQVEPEMSLPKLLARPLDRNYGDIDVLAWKPASGQVLVMECKNLQFHKTLGEVAEQLSDFRGETRPDGKSDHLKKHLERVRVLNSHSEAVARSLKLQAPIQMTGYLVFKNPVPMQFAWHKITNMIGILLFEELDKL